VLGQASDENEVAVTPLGAVYAFQVVPLVNDTIFDVDAVPMAKQVGVADELGQLSWDSAVNAGTVSWVQVTVCGVDAEMVAEMMVPPDAFVPMAKQAGVVALAGHTIWDSPVRPLGRVLVDQVPGEAAWATAATAPLAP